MGKPTGRNLEPAGHTSQPRPVPRAFAHAWTRSRGRCCVLPHQETGARCRRARADPRPSRVRRSGPRRPGSRVAWRRVGARPEVSVWACGLGTRVYVTRAPGRETLPRAATPRGGDREHSHGRGSAGPRPRPPQTATHGRGRGCCSLQGSGSLGAASRLGCAENRHRGRPRCPPRSRAHSCVSRVTTRPPHPPGTLRPRTWADPVLRVPGPRASAGFVSWGPLGSAHWPPERGSACGTPKGWCPLPVALLSSLSSAAGTDGQSGCPQVCHTGAPRRCSLSRGDARLAQRSPSGPSTGHSVRSRAGGHHPQHLSTSQR